MEVTSFYCYICKSEEANGVCSACLSTLPTIDKIKTEPCDCESIEETCGCLDSRWKPNKPSSTPTAHIEFEAELQEDPCRDGEQILKISATTASEWTITKIFLAWLFDNYSSYIHNE